MSATRTQVYFTVDQRQRLDHRAAAEDKTMAQIVREAVERYLANDVGDFERLRTLDETFGACPDFGDSVPSRDEWDRGHG